MVAIVGLNIEGVEKICQAAREMSNENIEIANYLVDGNYAISGMIFVNGFDILMLPFSCCM